PMSGRNSTAVWESPSKSELQLCGIKRITLLEVARLEALPEPSHALFRRTVGKRVRGNIALRLHLQPVIANRACRADRFFKIARSQHILGLLCMVRPHAGKEIGLQLQAYRQFVILFLAHGL